MGEAAERDNGADIARTRAKARVGERGWETCGVKWALRTRDESKDGDENENENEGRERGTRKTDRRTSNQRDTHTAHVTLTQH